MEKRKLNYRKDRNQRQVKWVDTLEPTGKEPDYTGSPNSIMSKQNVPGLQITPKMVILSVNSELGKSHVLPQLKKKVGISRETTMAQGIKETVKSEWHSVMECIEVQNLPYPEREQTCRRCSTT